MSTTTPAAGPDVLELAAIWRRTIVDHCRAAAPREGCGLLAIANGVVTAVYPTGNDAVGNDSFVVPPAQHHAALVDAESRGWVLGGSFHSHPTGPAEPSPRDIRAALDPDWAYLVVDGGGAVRAWRIVAGRVSEVGLD